jgi:hypothetical protein
VIFKRQYLAEKEHERVLKINDFEYVKDTVIILKPKIRTFQQNFSWTRQYFKTENLNFILMILINILVD